MIFAVPGFLLFFGLWQAPTYYTPLTQRNAPVGEHPLRLIGEVIKLKKGSENASQVGFDLTLRLTFTNTGSRPIIIFRGDRIPWVGGKEIASSKQGLQESRFLYDRSAWPSKWGKDARTGLRARLDRPDPPPEVTLTLNPGQSWAFERVIALDFERKERYDGTCKAWDEIKAASPVWLQVTLEMWPINVEPNFDMENPEFGARLREQWKNSGYLWLGYLRSQPIMLELNNFEQ